MPSARSLELNHLKNTGDRTIDHAHPDVVSSLSLPRESCDSVHRNLAMKAALSYNIDLTSNPI